MSRLDSPPGDEQRDPGLLRGELIAVARTAARPLPGRGELGGRAGGPPVHAEGVEAGRRGAQLLAGLHPPAGPAQPGAVQQPGPRRPERVGVQPVRGLERGVGHRVVGGEHAVEPADLRADLRHRRVAVGLGVRPARATASSRRPSPR